MLYWIAPYLTTLWGPFRLFSSHLMLLAAGTLTGGLIIWSFLPRLWDRLPTDRGKILAADGGMKSAGKPTGAGLLLSLLLLPVLVLFVPMGMWEMGVVACGRCVRATGEPRPGLTVAARLSSDSH